jgi:hypothetical protein
MTPEQLKILQDIDAKIANQQTALEDVNKRLQQGGEAESVMGGNQPKSTLGVMKQSAIKGVSGLADVVTGWPQDVANLYQYATTKGAPVPQKTQPITDYLKTSGVLTPENEPNTTLLKGLDFTTQLATGGGLNPVSMGRSLLTKTLPQAGKDIAGQFGRVAAQGAVGSTALQGMQGIGIENPLALAAGTAIPMGVVGGLTSMRGTPASITNEAMRGVSPEQLRMADMLLKQSYANGSPITGAEAIAQVAGQNPLQNVQRVVEASQKGGAITAPFMAARPEQNAQYMQNVLSGISQTGASSQIPVNMQRTAQGVIESAERGLSNKVSPYYQSASNVFLNDPDLITITTNPKIADAINAVTKTSKYGVKGADPHSLQTLIQAKHFLSDELANQINPMSGGLEKNAARVTTIAEKELSDFLKSRSPDYAKGSSIYQNAQQTQIGPMKQSGVGIMAEQTGTPAELLMKQREQLMPNNPVALFPQDIKRTVDLLRRKDPDLVPSWTAQNLEGIFNETAQNLQTGANQFGGAKFASAVTGNPQQKANLKTLITESAGPQAWQGFETFLDVMGAQGKRQPIGSQTAFNAQMQQELRGGGVGAVPSVVVKPSAIKQWYEDFRYGKNTEQLAKLLTDPDSVNLIKQLARTNPHSAKAQAVVDALAGGVIASKPQEKQ